MASKNVNIKKNGMVANSHARITAKISTNDKVGPSTIQFGFTGSPFDDATYTVPAGDSKESSYIRSDAIEGKKYTYCVKDGNDDMVDDPDIIIER